MSPQRALLPQLVHDALQEGVHAGEHRAVAVFVDLEGFTHLQQRLRGHGQAGAELLATAMARFFQPLVSAVHERGGSIVGFAGDAFTAVFQDDGTAGSRCSFTDEGSTRAPGLQGRSARRRSRGPRACSSLPERGYGGTSHLTRGDSLDPSPSGSAGSKSDEDVGIFTFHHNSWNTSATDGFRCIFVPM